MRRRQYLFLLGYRLRLSEVVFLRSADARRLRKIITGLICYFSKSFGLFFITFYTIPPKSHMISHLFARLHVRLSSAGPLLQIFIKNC